MDIQGNEQWSHDQGSVCACMIECDFEVRLCATWMSDIINLSGFKEYYSVPTRRVKLGLCRRTDNLCSQSSKNIYLKKGKQAVIKTMILSTKYKTFYMYARCVFLENGVFFRSNKWK